MKLESKEEIRFKLGVKFTDGRNLYLTDDIESIYDYLKKWSDMIEIAIIDRLD